MIRKFAPDIISICLVALAAFMLSVRPNVNRDIHQRTVLPKVIQQKISAAEVEDKSNSGAVASYKELEARNLFSANGSYATDEKATEIVIPENPYTLIGILMGKEARALFRDYKGSVIYMKAGDKMLDGSVIAEIDRTFVKLRMGEDEKIQKIFNIQSLVSGAKK
ncbi:hypothetical protein [Desulfobacterium sp. N47]|uniref:Uncharacterized protein n=1 Tax=uncultured Desulfobacterium sp. TaxID=201089 RepID=E1YBG3_9BACT|nr:hypothetical protein N47_G32310 [uncultured Desulfobacterium sp.]